MVHVCVCLLCHYAQVLFVVWGWFGGHTHRCSELPPNCAQGSLPEVLKKPSGVPKIEPQPSAFEAKAFPGAIAPVLVFVHLLLCVSEFLPICGWWAPDIACVCLFVLMCLVFGCR